jgi:hypothetical protein
MYYPGFGNDHHRPHETTRRPNHSRTAEMRLLIGGKAIWDAILTIETAIDASGILSVRAWQLDPAGGGSLLDLVTTLQELASPK